MHLLLVEDDMPLAEAICDGVRQQEWQIEHAADAEAAMPSWRNIVTVQSCSTSACRAPALLKARGARVIALSSRGHRYAAVDFDDPDFERRPYDRWIAYGQSKTANALFAVHLDAIGHERGIHAFSVHPGRIATDLARHLSREELQKAGTLDAQGKPIVDLAQGMKSIEQGAATSVWAATSPRLDGAGGAYCEDCDIAALDDRPANAPGDSSLGNGVRPWAIDPEAAQRLWKLSERLTGTAFD